jgi:hypothetical protein
MQRLLVCVLTLFYASRALAQAGPPFRTDDPETPGNRHWEINFGFIADHNPAAAYYQTPDFDINYGLGDRIQLKYELPISEYTGPTNTTVAGLGNSLLGVKWRYYEHRRAGAEEDDEREVNFSLSTYPQLSLDNPTSAVRRGVVQYRGPQFLLPLEANARIGWLRLDGEAGYWFGNRDAPDQWIRGIIAGHEFTEKTELYGEIYDAQDANRIDNQPKQREATLGLGGRHALNESNALNLLFMAGRSFQTVTRANSQPSWIAYIGVQLLLGQKTSKVQIERKVPEEDVQK